METNNEKFFEISENSTEFNLKYCKCTSKICGCELNCQLTKGLTDSILEYFLVTDIEKSIADGERLNTIFLWGTENRTTSELKQWMSNYSPRIEWINDYSCNLVFDSITDCLLVMDAYTEKFSFDDDADIEKSEAERCLSNGIYRCVTNLPENTKKMFMRFANKDDVKIKGAQKQSKFYLTHGNPRYENIKGITSKSYRERYKRNHDAISTDINDESGLVAYDDLPSVDVVTVQNSEVDIDGDLEAPSPKKRTMISSMKLYSDSIGDRNFSSRLKMDEKKKSVHSRLGVSRML